MSRRDSLPTENSNTPFPISSIYKSTMEQLAEINFIAAIEGQEEEKAMAKIVSNSLYLSQQKRKFTSERANL